jgi:hypothetical protein
LDEKRWKRNIPLVTGAAFSSSSSSEDSSESDWMVRRALVFKVRYTHVLSGSGGGSGLGGLLLVIARLLVTALLGLGGGSGLGSLLLVGRLLVRVRVGCLGSLLHSSVFDIWTPQHLDAQQGQGPRW